MNDSQAIQKAHELARSRGGDLLYLTKFGSHLYGTHTPESDTDFKGVFLPSMESLVLERAPSHITMNTGSDDTRNTSEDVDIQLWSFQYWLCNLVYTGDTNGIDLLFSHTNPGAVLFSGDEIMDDIQASPLHYFNPSSCRAYVGYAIGQARKYGVKGSRLGVIKSVYEWLRLNRYSVRKGGSQAGRWRDEDKLDLWLGEIVIRCGEGSYCFPKYIKAKGGEEGENIRALVLAGKTHLGTITMLEFWNRVSRDYERYGERAQMAERNEGIDWKALSHAVRAIEQMRDLLLTGSIKFPLSYAAKLKSVKAGEYSWPEVEAMITGGLEAIEQLQTDRGYSNDDAKRWENVTAVIKQIYGVN